MTVINEAELRGRLQTGKSIVVDFYADWCAPCRAIAPELDSLEAQYSDVDFVKVNADENADLVSELGILGIPTVIRFGGDGQEIARSTGAVKAEALALRLGLDRA